MSAPLKRGPAQHMPLLKGNSLNIYNGYRGVLQSMTRSGSSYKKAESGLYSLEQQGRLAGTGWKGKRGGKGGEKRKAGM